MRVAYPDYSLVVMDVTAMDAPNHRVGGERVDRDDFQAAIARENHSVMAALVLESDSDESLCSLRGYCILLFSNEG
jgi:hypothetical protein